MALTRAASLLCLAVAAALWVTPASAFDGLRELSRDVQADVVADASAYTAPVMLTCNLNQGSGGSCDWAIFNNATTPQRLTVTKQSDPDGNVALWTIDGSLPSNNVGTGTVKNVGEKSVISVTVTSCLGCGTKTVEWIVVGASTTAGVLDTREEHLAQTIVFG